MPPLPWSSPVITTAAFLSRGRNQNRGSGFRSQVHLLDQVGEQALLLVGLRDRDLVEVDPVGLDVPGLGAEEEIVGADRWFPPTGVALVCPDQAGLPWRV